MIEVHGVSKLYNLFPKPADRLRLAVPFLARPVHTEFWALQDISFTVAKGETLGLVGPNGCGKSTLLQIICGIIQPTRGRVVTHGRIAALLELGAGFNPEFTGRENVELSCEIIGLTRAEIAEAFPSIERFAEIGPFIDRPVKEYSSGMYVRLAFATAIHVNPDVLVVDEALAVGDAVFANRCVRKFEELRRNGITVLFVSHDLGLVKQLSDRAIFLLNGRIEAQGDPKDVINRYVGVVLERSRAEEVPARESKGSFRHGDMSSEIVSVRVLRSSGEEASVFRSGECMRVAIESVFHRSQKDPMVGILVRTRTGMDVYGTNTRLERVELGDFEAGEKLSVEFRFECWLAPQEYTLTVAMQYPDGLSHDWVDDAVAFRVIDEAGRAGVANLRAAVDWRKSS